MYKMELKKREKENYIMENTCDNNRDCPCTYDCPNHGKCCACVAHHRDHNEGGAWLLLFHRS